MNSNYNPDKNQQQTERFQPPVHHQQPVNQQLPMNQQQPVHQNSNMKQDISIYSHSYKIHGGKSALDVRATEKLRKSEENVIDKDGNKNLFHTIQLECAPKNDGKTRSYNWKRKVVLQLTDQELPLFICVCLGSLKKISFGNHGVGEEKNCKYFSIENQGIKLFMQIGNNSDKNKINLPIPINMPNAVHMGMIALEQYAKNFPALSSDTVLKQVHYIGNVYCSFNHQEIKDKIPVN